MKDSLKLMEIYRRYLELSEGLIELLESHCKNIEANNISDKLKAKYREFRKHTQYMINELNAMLHDLLKLDYELKEIEDEKKKN